MNSYVLNPYLSNSLGPLGPMIGLLTNMMSTKMPLSICMS